MAGARSEWSALAPRLKAARLAAGLTAFEACARSGVQPSSLHAYEAGTTEPKITSLLALCNVYGIDPRELAA